MCGIQRQCYFLFSEAEDSSVYSQVTSCSGEGMCGTSQSSGSESDDSESDGSDDDNDVASLSAKRIRQNETISEHANLPASGQKD